MLQWASWNLQNEVLFYQGIEDPEWPGRIDGGASAESNHNSKWFAPTDDGIFKLNTDAAISVEQGLVGVGAVVRDHRGKALITFPKRLQMSCSPECAEPKAFFEAPYSFLQTQEWHQIIVESDSKDVISHLRQRAQSGHHLHQTLEDIYWCSSSFSPIYFSFIKGTRNQMAHFLAKLALSISDVFVSFNSFPFAVEYYTDADESALA
ncbi:conserved hypothetical protein [Ricinus communis]|uniref:RNase H type-1 domain-containing protein n=1 Tax=Ricinus communis TaxID=3988 RepID=B9T333_RICCO|nr:conserved hypothetical protein [Ricinus communis]